jgi:hypothetical protein
MKLRALVIVAIVAAAGAGVALAIHLSVQHTDNEQKAVTIHASYTKTECNATSPVKVTVENGAERTLKALSFDLDVYLDGDSTNLSGVDGHQIWTKIVSPHSTVSTCFALPREARERIAQVRPSGRRAYTVRAQGHVASFYDEGEYVPPEAVTRDGSVDGRM